MNHELRSLFLAFVALIALTVVSLSIMTAVGVDKTQIGSMFVTIMGFATLIMFHWRTTSQAASKVEEVKRAAVESASVVAMNVEQVKQTVAASTAAADHKLDLITKTTNDTHTLVNNNMGVQLRLNADLSRWKADQSGDPQAIEAAVIARKAYDDHMLKQSNVDMQAHIDASKEAQPG